GRRGAVLPVTMLAAGRTPRRGRPTPTSVDTPRACVSGGLGPRRGRRGCGRVRGPPTPEKARRPRLVRRGADPRDQPAQARRGGRDQRSRPTPRIGNFGVYNVGFGSATLDGRERSWPRRSARSSPVRLHSIEVRQNSGCPAGIPRKIDGVLIIEHAFDSATSCGEGST